MTITITLTSAGSDSGPFDLYTNATGSFTLMESGVSKSTLLAGYTVTTLDGTTVVRVQSTGECTNYQDIPVQTTTTVAPTTTIAPTTTVAPCYNYEIVAYNDGPGCEGYINYSYYDCNDVYQTGGSISVGVTEYVCARDYPAITCGSGQVSYVGLCGAETTTVPPTTAAPTTQAPSLKSVNVNNNSSSGYVTVYNVEVDGIVLIEDTGNFPLTAGQSLIGQVSNSSSTASVYVSFSTPTDAPVTVVNSYGVPYCVQSPGSETIIVDFSGPGSVSINVGDQGELCF
jgi:hypothetical protein